MYANVRKRKVNEKVKFACLHSWSGSHQHECSKWYEVSQKQFNAMSEAPNAQSLFDAYCHSHLCKCGARK